MLFETIEMLWDTEATLYKEVAHGHNPLGVRFEYMVAWFSNISRLYLVSENQTAY